MTPLLFLLLWPLSPVPVAPHPTPRPAISKPNVKPTKFDPDPTLTINGAWERAWRSCYAHVAGAPEICQAGCSVFPDICPPAREVKP